MRQIRYWKWIFIIGLVLLSFLILLLSWVPHPLLAQLGWLPVSVSRWADAPEHVNSRTAVPFIGWGLFSGCFLVHSRLCTPAHWVRALLLGMLLLLLAEGGQWFLPFRQPDWGDVAWGTAGLVGGLVIIGVLGWFFARPTPKVISNKRVQ